MFNLFPVLPYSRSSICVMSERGGVSEKYEWNYESSIEGRGL